MQDASKSGWVIDVGDQDFEADVLERSNQVPVVLDFWAEWCGPCRMLSPLLEKLAREKAGAFVLAKINVEEAQELAGAVRLEGIPAVRVFRDQSLIDGFDGLIPEPGLREFLDRILPSEADQRAQEAQASEQTNPAKAEQIYREILAKDADHLRARVGLARLLVAA